MDWFQEPIEEVEEQKTAQSQPEQPLSEELISEHKQIVKGVLSNIN